MRTDRPKPALAAVEEAFASCPARGSSWIGRAYQRGRLHAQRSGDDCRMPRGLHGARLSELRGDRRRRRVDRPHCGDRRRLRRPRHLHPEQRARGAHETSDSGMRAERSSPTSTTMRAPTPTGFATLAVGFMTTPHAGDRRAERSSGDDGFLAECIAEAPGGPIHVLVSDREAEHIPGCNMAFRQRGSGRDRRLRRAFPDRRRRRRHVLAAAERRLDTRLRSGAMVWHRRRRVDSRLPAAAVRLWQGGGAARAQVAGALQPRRHLALVGHVYGGQAQRALGRRRWRIYYGTWGSGLFQSVYERAPSTLASLPAHAGVASADRALAAIAAYGDRSAQPLLFAVPPLAFRARSSCLPSPCSPSRGGLRGQLGRPARFAPTACRADEGDRW